MAKLSKESKQRLQQVFQCGQFIIRWGFIPTVLYLALTNNERRLPSSRDSSGGPIQGCLSPQSSGEFCEDHSVLAQKAAEDETGMICFVFQFALGLKTLLTNTTDSMKTRI
ncbi:hypothetical protein cypCar_00035926 [Cyprinus carpio]|nr:hypothetical protein cypCar_00035926 [Cyprinus carpio]